MSDPAANGSRPGTARRGYLSYNRYGVLRPSPALWTALLFQCRHILGTGLVLMASGRGMGSGGAQGRMDLSELGNLLEPVFLLSDMPALLVLLTIAARLPGAGALPRRLWRHGRILMVLSVAAYVALFVAHLPPRAGAVPLVDWVGLAGTLAVGGYVLLSRYVRDLFTEFPESPPA